MTTITSSMSSEATAEAKAILIAGLDSAKSELAAHLTRHHPEAAARIAAWNGRSSERRRLRRRRSAPL